MTQNNAIPVVNEVTKAGSKKLLTRELLESYDTASEPWAVALGRRYLTHHELKGILNNIEDVPDSIYDHFDMRLTPYLVQLMDKDDPNCPIRLQYMPNNRESETFGTVLDSLGEDDDTIPGTRVVHRYPQRVLFLCTPICASYCRYCTRKRFVSHTEQNPGKDVIEASVEYIQSNPEIQDVLLSGGDPLMLSDRKLDEILGKLRAIPHVKFLRIGSRLAAQLPTRITPELCEILERHNVQMLNIHVNHPKEITPLLVERLKLLRKAGVMLGNQAVLLRGVNDSVEVLRNLCMGMVAAGVRPYYIYSCDPTEGNPQFTVPLDEMLELSRGLRGWISGPAVPTFIVDGVGGLGKMPVQADYYVEGESGELVFTNYEGQSYRMSNLEK